MQNILDKNGAFSSVYPCTEYLTFGPWIYLVPQYKPESILILGFAGGTVAGLIRKLYGNDIPITAVDIEKFDNDFDKEYNVRLIINDANDYIKTSPKFDAVIIDLYDSGPQPPDFVFTKEFVSDLEKKANYVVLHVVDGADISAYSHLHKVKTLSLNKSRFHYFMINRIARLPIRWISYYIY